MQAAQSQKPETATPLPSPIPMFTSTIKGIRLDNNTMPTRSDVTISPDHQWSDRLTCHSIPLSAPKVMTSKVYMLKYPNQTETCTIM